MRARTVPTFTPAAASSGVGANVTFHVRGSALAGGGTGAGPRVAVSASTRASNGPGFRRRQPVPPRGDDRLQRRDPVHQRADAVRGQPGLPLADRPEVLFQVVREPLGGPDAGNPGQPFEGVEVPEQLVELFAAGGGRVGFEPEQQSAGPGQVLVALDQVIGEQVVRVVRLVCAPPGPAVGRPRGEHGPDVRLLRNAQFTQLPRPQPRAAGPTGLRNRSNRHGRKSPVPFQRRSYPGR
jgi:hypothetical protein